MQPIELALPRLRCCFFLQANAKPELVCANEVACLGNFFLALNNIGSIDGSFEGN